MPNKDLVREVLDDLIEQLPVGCALERIELKAWLVVNENKGIIGAGKTPTEALDVALLVLRND